MADDGAPLCQHGDPAVKKVVRKDGPTKGKSFWSCSHYPESCKFFEWCPPDGDSKSTSSGAKGSSGSQPQPAKSPQSSRQLPSFMQQQQQQQSSSSSSSTAGASAGNWWTKHEKGLTPGVQSKQASSSNPCRASFEIYSGSEMVMKADFAFAEAARIEKLIRDAAGAGVKKPSAHELVFPIQTYQSLFPQLESMCRELKSMKSEFPLESAVKTILEAPQKHFSRILHDDMFLRSNLPPALYGSLMPFQKEGVLFVLNNNGRALIADHPGLGKTIQAIASSYIYHKEWPMLILVPSSVRFQWKHELLRWLPDGFVADAEIHIVLSTRGDAYIDGEEFQVVIMSYDLVSKVQDRIKESQFKVIVADEAHYIKNLSAQRTTAILPILKKSKRCILLTGTPAMSRPIELYTQIQAVMPTLFPKKELFGVRYCAAKETAYGVDYSGSSHPDELFKILSHCVMIRRQKQDVFKQLPAKRRQRVDLPVSDKVKASFKARLDQLRELEQQVAMSHGLSPEQMLRSENMIKAAMMDLWRDTCSSKISAVEEYVSDLIDSGLRFIVFGHHGIMLAAMEDLCKKKKVGYIFIDGSTPPERRFQMAERFRTDLANCQVAVLSMTAAGTGITLTPCSDVVFAELQWTPGLMFQCEDRVHRIGQENSVLIRYLLARGTFDDTVWNMLQKKLSVIGKTLEGTAENSKMDFEGSGSGSSASSSTKVNPQQGALDMYFQRAPDSTESGLSQNSASSAASGNGKRVVPPTVTSSPASKKPKVVIMPESDDDDVVLVQPTAGPTNADTVSSSQVRPVVVDDDFDDEAFDWDSYIKEAEQQQARDAEIARRLQNE